MLVLIAAAGGGKPFLEGTEEFANFGTVLMVALVIVLLIAVFKYIKSK